MAEETTTPNSSEYLAPTEDNTVTPPTTGEQLIERLGEQATGGEKTVPEAGKITTIPQEVQEDEVLTNIISAYMGLDLGNPTGD